MQLMWVVCKHLLLLSVCQRPTLIKVSMYRPSAQKHGDFAANQTDEVQRSPILLLQKFEIDHPP
jgi:hypothetical protein